MSENVNEETAKSCPADVAEENHKPEKIVDAKNIASPLIAGAAAGAVAKTTIAPLDRTKISFQRVLDSVSFTEIIEESEEFSIKLNSELEITRREIKILESNQWLNDSLIDFYLALIMERGKDIFYPSIYVFNTFFYTSLKSRGPVSVLRWTAKIGNQKTIFDFDIIFVPLHFDAHWALCAIDNRTKQIKYYDSQNDLKSETHLEIINNYLIAESKHKLNFVKDPTTYTSGAVNDIPRQRNYNDCGMFTLKYAEYLSRDAPITFNQADMMNFRKLMIIEIVNKKVHVL